MLSAYSQLSAWDLLLAVFRKPYIVLRVGNEYLVPNPLNYNSVPEVLFSLQVSIATKLYFENSPVGYMPTAY